MPRRSQLSEEQEREVAQLYQNSTPVPEIMDTYDIGNGTLYRILGKYQVATRRRTTKTRVNDVVLETEVFEQEVVVKPQPLAIVLDSNDMVQTTHRVTHGPVSTWEIKYTGILLLEAETIEQALAEARKISAVKKIYGVRLK